MDGATMDPARLEILQLRARIVALERATLAALELALRIRPEELSINLEKARRRLQDSYLDNEFAAEITHSQERTFLSQEVERLMRAIQSEMGFPQGIQAPEEG
jgi:HAMP domain-containing protein